MKLWRYLKWLFESPPDSDTVWEKILKNRKKRDDEWVENHVKIISSRDFHEPGD